MGSLIYFSVWLAGVAFVATPVDASQAKQNIARFLKQHCSACHGAAENRVVPELNVLDMEQLEDGVYLVPGDAANSQIWERVEKGEMPPPTAGPIAEDTKRELALSIQAHHEPRDIVATLKADRRLETAVKLAENAEMIGLLKSPGPFTILAPTDSAFELLSPANRKALEKEARALLYNHGILGSYSSDELLRKGTVMSAHMCLLPVRKSQDGQIYVGDQNALIEVGNIKCTNGVIHLIDRVLIPHGLTLPEPPVGVAKAGVEWVEVRGGQFLMGPALPEDPAQHESQQRRVEVSSFRMATHEITWEQYWFVMKDDPVDKIWIRVPPANEDPVNMVSWNQACEFCNRMSILEGLTPYYAMKTHGDEVAVEISNVRGDGWRLPTEAEWEYACRAGSLGDFCFGNDASLLANYAWFSENTTEAGPVRKKKPNAFGLFDMHGNVAEWCQDWYADAEPGTGQSLTDPRGPTTGTMKVYRGGSYVRAAEGCRSDWRYCAGLTFKHDGIGFRVARTPKRGELDPRFVVERP